MNVTIQIALRSASQVSEIIKDIALDLGCEINRVHSCEYDVESNEDDGNIEDLIVDVECALLEYGINIEDIQVNEA
jgi:type IV pilus biogenesis protein CpaD/CtpE